MFDLNLLLTLIPGLPLAAAVLVGLLGRPFFKHKSHWPVVLAIGLSFVLSLVLLRNVAHEAPREPSGAIGYERIVTLWKWANVEDAIPASSGTAWDFNIDVTLRADPLTAIMLVMVTFISTLIAIYSIGYMHGDSGYPRFFALIALFVFSMTMLVSVSNFLMLYVFWEAVGACSYLLIGFWFHKPEAAAAGKKAFLVNRVGDFGFALAVFLIWINYHTLDFHDPGLVEPAPRAYSAGAGLREQPSGVLGQVRLKRSMEPSPATATDPAAHERQQHMALAICLLLMLGACGKSAQFPLHVWLPDAMEGPTPVSALIHAATMVTAGVYLVARCAPLFAIAGGAGVFVSAIGAVTALIAGYIALTQNDLKRVLAYSTVSQLGYMFLALGTGSVAGIIAGMFHLFTHAFFKALLFLGAGSVMHAMGGVIDMRRFGGLKRIMPITYWTFLVGCLALAGFPFLSGFWSKDAILAAVDSAAVHDPLYSRFYSVLYSAALVAAFLTAFYTFRAFFMTFFGEERVPPEAGHHAHESPGVMTTPLVILAVFALGIGGYLEWTHGFADLLALTPSLAMPGLQKGPLGEMHWDIAASSSVIALAGIALAAFMYLGNRREAEWMAEAPLTRPLYQLSYRKLLFDEVYNVLVVWPLWILAQVVYLIDRILIDGLVNLVGWVPQALGALSRPFGRGLVSYYALSMVAGVFILLAIIMYY
jgi:NADH-quinone oxidoreductase subunit L